MTGAVLHITSAPGGGVDRYIRDVAAGVAGRHLALHVGADIDVLEDLAARRYWPLSSGNAATAAAAAGTRLVHLHSVDRRARGRAEAILARDGAVGVLATLHDLGFLHPTLFAGAPVGAPEAAWIGEVRQMLRRAHTVIAPSEYIRAEMKAWMPDVPVTVVAPGVPRRAPRRRDAPAAFVEQAPRHVIAVVGAVGPHKGSTLLRSVAAAIAEHDAALVVIGYTDEQLLQGWVTRGLFVHGPYADDDLPGWLAAYRPSLALFPNRVPESFSYTLSEVWSAGIPVIVPDEGALGARVRAHGGGWVLPAGFDGATAARLIGHLLDVRAPERARVESTIVSDDPSVVPPLGAMADAIGAIYAQFDLKSAQSAPADVLDVRLQSLLATNLDGFAFRQELVQLCGALHAAQSTTAASQAWAEKLQGDVDAAKQWAAKLEGDVAALTAALQARDSTTAELAAKVERMAQDTAAFALLPQLVRRALRRWASRGRS